jgi:hypothetical protein
MPIFINFWSKMLKSIRSNAFENSNVQIRRQVPGVSITSYHLWNIYNAIVKLDLLSARNWRLSIWPLTDRKRHLWGNDSKILLTIGVREIGLKSESMSRAGDDFGTGDTLADFHNDGMFPSWIEELKIDANVRDREAEFSRRSQGEISSGPAAEWHFTDISAFSTSSMEI